MEGMSEDVAVELLDGRTLRLEPGEAAREDLVALLVDQPGSCCVTLIHCAERPAGFILLPEEPGQKAQYLGNICSALLVVLGGLLAAVVLYHAGPDEHPQGRGQVPLGQLAVFFLV